MMAKFGKTPADVIAKVSFNSFRGKSLKSSQAVFDLDTIAINFSIAQIMIEQCPTNEEQKAVAKYFEENGNDVTKLDKAEKYILEISKVFCLYLSLILV